MRISDWSRRVLFRSVAARPRLLARRPFRRRDEQGRGRDHRRRLYQSEPPDHSRGARSAAQQDRKRVVQGKRVSVRVDIGGRRVIKKKTKRKADVPSHTKYKSTAEAQITQQTHT